MRQVEKLFRANRDKILPQSAFAFFTLTAFTLFFGPALEILYRAVEIRSAKRISTQGVDC